MVMVKIREVEKVVLAKEHAEAQGANIRCALGRGHLLQLDPFLLLDHVSIKPPAGFPDHPHRGFETVTYVLKGSFIHEDFAGHKGTIRDGGVQWMTAGRGVLHSETPGPEGGEGLQLWVNLAKADKMVVPAYQDLKASNIPVAKQGGISVVVIAGESLGVKSSVRTRTPTAYLDISLAPGEIHVQPVESGWNAFSYILHGKVTFGPEEKPQDIETYHCAVFSKEGDVIRAVSTGDDTARFVIIAGKPLNEPLARHGPFVMNTHEEIAQALEDLRTGKNGFERAKNWKSEYVRRKGH